MARLRKFCSYRRLERPYTRKSKFKKMSYVKSTPNCRIVKFDMGNPRKRFQYTVSMVAKTNLQIRDNALESARQVSNRLLEKILGKGDFYLKMRTYPHHILRENPLASGAGADRMSTGMSSSFGKSIGIAARIKKDQKIVSVHVNKTGLNAAKKALNRAATKLPCSCGIRIIKNNPRYL